MEQARDLNNMSHINNLSETRDTKCTHVVTSSYRMLSTHHMPSRLIGVPPHPASLTASRAITIKKTIN